MITDNYRVCHAGQVLNVRTPGGINKSAKMNKLDNFIPEFKNQCVMNHNE